MPPAFAACHKRRYFADAYFDIVERYADYAASCAAAIIFFSPRCRFRHDAADDHAASFSPADVADVHRRHITLLIAIYAAAILLSDADFAMFAYFQLSPLRHRRHIISIICCAGICTPICGAFARAEDIFAIIHAAFFITFAASMPLIDARFSASAARLLRAISAPPIT
jgi:hypothetical protein